jgi:hypothetical protein
MTDTPEPPLPELPDSESESESDAYDPYDKLPKTKPVTFRSWLTAQVYGDTKYAHLARVMLNKGYDGNLKGYLSAKIIYDHVLEMSAASHPSVTPEDLEAIKTLKRDWAAAKKETAASAQSWDQAMREASTEIEIEQHAAQAEAAEIVVAKIGRVEGVEGDATNGYLVPMWHTQEGPPVWCTWTKPTGNYRCRRPAVNGSVRCEIHGGLLVDQKKMAELLEAGAKKLVSAADMAVDVLVELAQTSPNDLVRVRAAEDILDRAGLAPGQQVEVTVKSTESPVSVIAERLDKLAQFAVTDGSKNSLEDDAIDAEIIEVDSRDSIE